MASKMAEISNTQDQYYLNYLQEQAENERSDNATSFDDFINNISTLSTKESRDDFVNSRITEKDGKFYLDGRELTANEVTRYKSAMYVSDEKLNDTSSENAIKNSDNSMTYEPNGEMSIKYDFNIIQKAYDSEGNIVTIPGTTPKNFFGNSFHAMDELMKNSSIPNGTIIKMDGFLKDMNYGDKGKTVSVYAVYKDGKLYYIKDDQEKWNKTSADNRIYIDKDGNITRGSKTKG